MRDAWWLMGGLLTSGCTAKSTVEAPPPPHRTPLPLRVHLFASDNPDVDARGLRAGSTLSTQLEGIDEIFAPARVAWQVESVVVEPVGALGPWQEAAAGRQHHTAALKALVRPKQRLAPQGFDLYVVGNLTTLKVGGAFLCDAERGGAFVSARTGRGKLPPVRKWAHELGHALGLRHTLCRPEAAERLMMSGHCTEAIPGRKGLSDKEVAQIRTQATRRTSVSCRKGENTDQAD
ncbi:MAG: hypothetical protein AAGA48_27775 [Myxococcota bacterium]